MKRLNNRRRSITDEYIWNSTRVHMTAGMDNKNRVREVFLTGSKEHSTTGRMLDASAQAISIMLVSRKIETLKKAFPYTTEPMPCGNINLNDEAVITVTINKLAELQESIRRGGIKIC